MDELKFREGLNEVSEVLKVFVAAKKNKGQSFIDELIRLYSIPENKAKFQEFYKRYDSYTSQPVNVVRARILEKLISTGSVSMNDVEMFQNEEAKNHDKNVFKSWTTYSILYVLYRFFDDLKTKTNGILDEIQSNLFRDAGYDCIHGVRSFDYNQAFGIDDFYIYAFNKSHESWDTAIQFRVQSKGANKLLVGLMKNKNFVKGKFIEYDINKITYEELLNNAINYRDDIVNDIMLNVIDYVKANIDKYADIKDKAEAERKAFNEKFPLEKLRDLPLEDYNYGMGNANNGSFTGYLNTDFLISGWLFSNGQNHLFYKGENGEYKMAKNMKDYLDRGDGDIRQAFQLYKNDLYDFVKNFDINTYDPKTVLDGANYIKAALVFMYKGDFLVTLGLPATCKSIATALNILPEGSDKTRSVDILTYDKIISDYLEKEIPEIVDKYGYSAIAKCLDKYHETYLMRERSKEDISNNYYAIGADLGNGDKQDEFYSRGKLIIGWYEIGDLKQYETEEALVKRYGECNFHDTESHFKQTFSQFKQIKKGDIVCVKSVHLQKHEMYIYAVGEVLEGYNNGYEYLEGLGHSLPVRWKILDNKYVVDGAKYQKTLTKINDEEIKQLLDELMLNNKPVKFLNQNPSKTMINLNTILYGVPGTGKTFNSINYAVAVIENKSIDDVKNEDRKFVKERFENYVKEGQVVFTTFHQSFGYEDFVEGIKANVEDGAINYTVEDGIFKKLCKTAEKGENKTIDNFQESWDLLVEKLNENDFIDIPLINDSKKTFRVELNEYGTGLASRTYENDEYKKGEWIHRKSKFFNYEQLYNIYKGLPGIPSGGHDNYRKAIVNEMKRNFGLKEYQENLIGNNTKNYILIIDEINRGNISKVFGELITLLEADKRLGNKEELKVKLPYSQKEFGVPNNLYILGTMNTADRSIALMDLALRRRFTFKEIEPDSSLLEGINVNGINVREFFDTVNKRIEFLYDRDHLLGHAYFLPLKDDPSLDRLNHIVLDKVIPLLQEYFHDDWEKIQLVLGKGLIQSEDIIASDILGTVTSDYEDQTRYYINFKPTAGDYNI